MTDPDLICKQEHRRDDVRASTLLGLDYVEVSDDQLTLYVYLLGRAPERIEKANISLQGGRRIRDVQVTDLRVRRQKDPTLDDYLEITVNHPGDFSTYTLALVGIEGFDPRYSEVSFSFKASCPSDLDCKTPHRCPPPKREGPDINYLAKDYNSFRQLILDRLALIMPDWQETHVPDLGVTLVELLAYVGDYLSYYQDAVATEAYLGTARQRISVRRHVRLIDYAMHEGCNARAWITIWTDAPELSLDPRRIYFITGFPGAPSRGLLTSADLVTVPPAQYEVFEPLWPAAIQVYQAHSEIHFYTWGDCQCCLAKGATAATLVDRWVSTGDAPAGDRATAQERALHLRVGDVLIFEEVIGPKTGNPADADPTHRQAVRLIEVSPAIDPLYPDRPIVEIAWAPEDALTFPLCLSVQAPPPNCDCLENVSVARGNVVLVDHGARTSEELGTVSTLSTTQRCATRCTPAEITITPGLFRPTLSQRPLTFSQALPVGSPASQWIAQDPRKALPDIQLSSIPASPATAGQVPPLFTFGDIADPTGLAFKLRAPSDPAELYLYGQLSPATRQALTAWNGASPVPAPLLQSIEVDLRALVAMWSPRRDLLESGPDDAAFVAEMDDDGYGHLRFGDDNLGMAPDAGTAFLADYRVGNGPSGNVGAETIRYLVLRDETLSGVNVMPRNPMAAEGGAPPEPVAEVKMFAPYVFRDVLERAITADDYAALAAADPKLQGARATLRWNGSWYTALVAVDPKASEDAPPALLHEVSENLERYRRVGHDLLVEPAEYVPLDLALTVCVLPNYQRAHVESALLQVLARMFDPDNLTFGEGISVSRILAAAQAVAGVQNAIVTRLERYEIGEPAAGESDDEEVPAGSLLTLGPLQIARLDNDPNFPEHGRVSLDLRGGR